MTRAPAPVSRRLCVGLALAIVALAGCGSSTIPATTTAPLPPPAPIPAPVPGDSLVAQAAQRSVAVFARPGAARPAESLASPNPYGFRRLFLVRRMVPGWLDVYLPMRPNGVTGWVRRQDVALVPDPYSLVIDLRRHRITVRRRGLVIDRAPIGVGQAVTPTPSGVYFLTELFRLTDAGGPYGPYGFGLSAYSNVLHQFAGADGQIGIHGTNDPAGIGSDVSHGCIRMANTEITRLARLLPLGTPVRIVRSAAPASPPALDSTRP
ncbi:MAG: L,D-transpeptidase [Solirubrobacteraceae bacterium]